ncbi:MULTISPECIES: class I SAM-dependent methyltransferase [Flavobacterium]|jgi:ubiquinone/menaquinone biosynthesis C-methylase UbiE|uniref:Methyltransferase type 11 domain-containing protein n=2 Tax=Flavobacterium TaxID=237 RepID=A0ABP8ZRJ9_9FLAO|nr:MULTISPECIES: class I SAM-dependent methyltransferase [Flavobacterium]MBN8642852.1 class I SAM-dependent methyltransferase [Flavobacteriales bacterium]MCW1148332.1 class I SAM-dependent methyltransferase [Flavobacterium lacisediminis]UGS24690.1 class I SAM-dependent methyltransferase [Flavobacterium channae]HLO72720.1 class I SAM-dependent methyltransferase [Flavobacterium sp.]
MSTTKFIPALGYDFLSDYYDLAIKITMPEKKFRNRLVDFVNPKEDEKILEFGFGTAQNIIILKQRFPDSDVQGVDIDPKIKSIAEYKLNKAGIHAPLFLYDGNKLPFEDKSFDKVYSSLVFHQLDSVTKLKCLLEINRILKPEGELIIGDWGKAKTKWMRFSFYLVQLLDGFKTTNDNVNGLMIKYISDARFKNVEEIDHINTSIGTYSYYLANKINY